MATKKMAPAQLRLDLRARKHGGRREGAGRKPGTGKRCVPHRARPAHRSSDPLHVTMRAGVRGLRRQVVFARVREAIARASNGAFRVVHFSVQDNHLHLLVEAADRRQLTRGVRGLAVRIALAVNDALRRRGQVFSERYHARELTRPRAVRNALVYILNNHRKHAVSLAWLDPCSSALHFDGWRQDMLFATVARASRRAVGARRDHGGDADSRGPRDQSDAWQNDSAAVVPAKTWLATVGWRRQGLLGIDESPSMPD